MPTKVPHLPFKVRVGILGRRGAWIPVAASAAASQACREFIEAHDLGASEWCGGRVVDAERKKVVANVSYNGRVWMADGTETAISGSA